MDSKSRCAQCGGPLTDHQFCHACGVRMPCDREPVGWTTDSDGHVCARCGLKVRNRPFEAPPGEGRQTFTVVMHKSRGDYAVRIERGSSAPALHDFDGDPLS